jgi:hypothetical protein
VLARRGQNQMLVEVLVEVLVLVLVKVFGYGAG